MSTGTQEKKKKRVCGGAAASTGTERADEGAQNSGILATSCGDIRYISQKATKYRPSSPKIEA